jgi:hypothetical protein
MRSRPETDLPRSGRLAVGDQINQHFKRVGETICDGYDWHYWSHAQGTEAAISFRCSEEFGVARRLSSERVAVQGAGKCAASSGA